MAQVWYNRLLLYFQTNPRDYLVPAARENSISRKASDFLVTHDADLQLLSLTGIARRCAQESDLFFRHQPHNPRYCYELLRRAILERDQHAWELIYSQYRPLVVGWVTRHPAFADSGEELEFFVNSAYGKFWSAVSPDKFLRFPDLKSLLRYLQMCVHSVIVDHARMTALPTLRLAPEIAVAGDYLGQVDVIHQTIALSQRQEFWRWIEAHLRNEKERQVVYGSFFLNLKPREIYMHYRGVFRNVGEVHRIKENLLARLRRDPELRKLFGEDA